MTVALLGALGLVACPVRAEEPDAKEKAADPANDGRVRYTLEDIEIRSDGRTGKRVVLHYVRFRAGDVLDVADPEIELTRYRLLSTGFFADVRLSLRRG